jgi:hypothetical protein
MKGWDLWLTPVIPATQKAEMRKIEVKEQSAQKKPQKKKKLVMVGHIYNPNYSEGAVEGLKSKNGLGQK